LASIPPGGRIHPTRGTHRRTHRHKSLAGQLITLPTHRRVMSAKNGASMGQPGSPAVPARDAGVSTLFGIQPHRTRQPTGCSTIRHHLRTPLKTPLPRVASALGFGAGALMPGPRPRGETRWRPRDTTQPTTGGCRGSCRALGTESGCGGVAITGDRPVGHRLRRRRPSAEQ